MGGVEPYVFDWSNNETGPLLTGLNNGTYMLTVTDANGCTQEETILLETTSTDNWAALNRFALYPNPSNGLFYLELQFNTFTVVDISIHNALGQVVYTMKTEGQELMLPINLSQQLEGVYFVNLKTENGQATRRVILGK